MRFTSRKILVFLAAFLMAAPAAPAFAQEPIVVEGGGWGHGIGMPQFGAKAMAESGHNHEQILQYFYSGAQFGWVGAQFTAFADPLHIGVGLNQTVATFQAVNGNITVVLEGVEFTPQVGEIWQLQRDGFGQCHLFQNSALVGSSPNCVAAISWAFQPDTRVYFHELNRTYARGRVIFKPTATGTFHTIVELPLENYLLGLAEVPSSWHMEALKAQVVAARSYALYKAWSYRESLRSDCLCHLHGSTVDQAYRGWGPNFGEGGASGSRWVQAVTETSGKALWHPYHGSWRALEAYYFSSTGGATENNEDVWSPPAYPYLRVRPDPGPTFWSAEIGQPTFAAALGFDQVIQASITAKFASGSPKTIKVTGIVGAAQIDKTFTGSQLRSLLGLRSHYITSLTGFLPFFVAGADIPALHDPTTGIWSLWSSGGHIHQMYYGNAGDYAFMGDWNCDGIETPGLYRRSNGYVYLRNSNTQGIADISYYFGNAADIPIAGDFNGDNCDTVSIYRPSQARFYIINRLGSGDAGLGAADYSYLYGVHGDVPFVGDWNGDGVDTAGLRRNSNGFVYLRNSNTQGIADVDYFYGNAGDIVFAGDWNADGVDTLGLYRPSNGFAYLRNTNTTGIADVTFEMGGSVHKPVAGSR